MTEGEKMVWAALYAAAFIKHNYDAKIAARTADFGLVELLGNRKDYCDSGTHGTSLACHVLGR